MAFTEWDWTFPRIVPKDGVPEIAHHYKEYDSETFKAGMPVYVANTITTATGEVKVAADTCFSGIAMKSATNVTSSNTEIPIMVGRVGDVLVSQVFNGSDTAIYPSLCTPGSKYDVYVGTAKCGVDYSDTSGGFFQFIGSIYDVNGDETYWGRFLITAATTGCIG